MTDILTASAQIAISACDNARIIHLLDQHRPALAIDLAKIRAVGIISDALDDDDHPLADAARVMNQSHGPRVMVEIQRAIVARFSMITP